MFTLQFDRKHRLALVRFFGSFTSSDIANFDHAADKFIAAEGPSDFVLDFTAVRSVAMPDRAMVARGRRPQSCPGYRRVVVAPQPEIFGLYQIFAAHQLRIGSEAPVIVRTLHDALGFLGVGTPDLSPS
jgi:hypothetical protein